VSPTANDAAVTTRLADRAPINRASGFTLLEIIVAVSIAGLALIGLFKAGSAGLFAVDAADRRQEAIERAQSHLAAFAATSGIAPGETEGDDGGGYHWRLRARPLLAWQASAAEPGAAAMTLYEVESVISWGSAGRERSIVLTTRRIGSGAVAP
jgi:general secretion pathway protein I